MAKPESRAFDLRLLFNGTQSVADRQTVLLRADGSPRRVLLLVSGWASRERLLPDGRRAILDLYLPGDLIGLDALFVEHLPDSTVALAPVVYHVLERDALEGRLRENPEAALALLRYAADEKQRLHRHATRLNCLPAIERMAAGLHALCERLSATGGKVEQHGRPAFRLPLSQQQMADYFGINVVHLNRTLRALRNGGVLKIEQGIAIIEDTNRLRAVAGAALDLA